MAHIILSIPDEIYAEMKSHPEIKWSEIARKSIIEKTLPLKKSIKGKEMLELLSEETRKEIQSTDKEKWVEFYKKVKEKETFLNSSSLHFS